MIFGNKLLCIFLSLISFAIKGVLGEDILPELIRRTRTHSSIPVASPYIPPSLSSNFPSNIDPIQATEEEYLFDRQLREILKSIKTENKDNKDSSSKYNGDVQTESKSSKSDQTDQYSDSKMDEYTSGTDSKTTTTAESGESYEISSNSTKTEDEEYSGDKKTSSGGTESTYNSEDDPGISGGNTKEGDGTDILIRQLFPVPQRHQSPYHSYNEYPDPHFNQHSYHKHHQRNRHHRQHRQHPGKLHRRNRKKKNHGRNDRGYKEYPHPPQYKEQGHPLNLNQESQKNQNRQYHPDHNNSPKNYPPTPNRRDYNPEKYVPPPPNYQPNAPKAPYNIPLNRDVAYKPQAQQQGITPYVPNAGTPYVDKSKPMPPYNPNGSNGPSPQRQQQISKGSPPKERILVRTHRI